MTKCNKISIKYTLITPKQEANKLKKRNCKISNKNENDYYQSIYNTTLAIKVSFHNFLVHFIHNFVIIFFLCKHFVCLGESLIYASLSLQLQIKCEQKKEENQDEHLNIIIRSKQTSYVKD